MRIVVAGLGNQGQKRERLAGDAVVATVDPLVTRAAYRRIEDVPLELFDAAFVCTSNQAKCEILHYLLANQKHVLVEKPLVGIDNTVLQSLIQIVRKNNLACYTAYNHRFEPHLITLKGLLETGTLGRLNWARLFYGNGTARDVRNSPWRDQGLGVLSDLGSHLLDLSIFLFGKAPRTFKLCTANCFENRSFDHASFLASGEPLCEFEVTLLSWKNIFGIDVYGELGSAHIDGLCKWGPSKLTIRRRVLPSGKPLEEETILNCPDPTWQAEHSFFRKFCKTGGTNLDNDIHIQTILQGIEQQLER